MKIAFFHELAFGGARRVVKEYGKVLQKDHNLRLYYVSGKKDLEMQKYFHDVHFYPFSTTPYRGNNWKRKLYKDTVELIKLYFLHRHIASEINKQSFDFVFVHSSQFTHAPFILRFLTSKKVYYCQEPLRIVYDDALEIPPNLSVVKKCYEMLSRNARKFIDKTNLERADIILANSKFSRRNIEQAYKKQAFLCYLGVDTNTFSPQPVEKNYDILYVGTRSKIKGYDLLMESLVHFPNKPRAVVIDGSNGKYISDYVLAKEYNKAKVVVAFSQNEPFGFIPLEAMACGVPVVALAEGGFLESIVDGKTGFLVKRDPKDVYKVLRRLLTNEVLRDKVGKEAREYILASWTWEKSTRELLNIINQK